MKPQDDRAGRRDPLVASSDQHSSDQHRPDQRAGARSAGLDQGMQVLSYLIAGVLLYGGFGWLADHLLHTGFLLPVGIVGGAALACYVIIRRYGEAAADPLPRHGEPGDAVVDPVRTTTRSQESRWTR